MNHETNTTRRRFVQAIPAVGAGFLLGENHALAAEDPVQPTLQGGNSWQSPSLRSETATGPNGGVAAAETFTVNARMGADRKAVSQPAPGIYALAGWGIAISYAIDAPGGWIIIDTGDTTTAAAEMRAMLEKTIGRRIKVAAILLTHWHYANGIDAWLDEGTELWGHERLDANREVESGLSPFRGVGQSRAIAQFGILHPQTGPDAFPNVLGFGPEKLGGETSYQPPRKLFPDGKIVQLTIAGEAIEVAPVRTDTMDSVGFWFPGRKLLVTNFMVTPVIFNIFTLRGGRYRDPMILVNDARWLESKDAEVLLDIHNAPILGRAAVQQAVERSVDQTQQIHDQTIRLIAQGLDARQAAEAITMSPQLRDGAELYGQVESHVRAVWGHERGWFGSDVYDINPLSGRDEAERLVAAMGGVPAVRQAAAKAVADGGIDNWRWGLKLTSLLLAIDPNDKVAREARIGAARAMGQRTISANARGFYITEALQLEGRMLAMGQPVTVDLLRRVLGTPQKAQLTAAPVASVLEYLRYLVDPVKAGNKRIAFTLAVEDDPAIYRMELRNGVLVISPVEKAGPIHVAANRAQLADFVLGAAPLPGNAAALADFGQVFDRSEFLSRESLASSALSKPVGYPH
jgi:alkyl sulfatase BDS1-like metallo-beta-lactamase superfamily hydrolase